MTSFWGDEPKEITFEEFPFENINNLTSHQGSIILRGFLCGIFIERLC